MILFPSASFIWFYSYQHSQGIPFKHVTLRHRHRLSKPRRVASYSTPWLHCDWRRKALILKTAVPRFQIFIDLQHRLLTGWSVNRAYLKDHGHMPTRRAWFCSFRLALYKSFTYLLTYLTVAAWRSSSSSQLNVVHLLWCMWWLTHPWPSACIRDAAFMRDPTSIKLCRSQGRRSVSKFARVQDQGFLT